MHEVLALAGVPDGLRGPDHAGAGVLDDDEALAAPVHEIGRLPDEDALGALSLGGVPCRLNFRVRLTQHWMNTIR